VFESSALPIVFTVALCGAASAIIDLRTKRVPNPLTLGIASIGVTLAAMNWSGLSVSGALAGLVVGLLLMLPGYVFGATGGGDVKLFAATGTLLGPKLVVFGFLYTLIAGGVLAVIVAARRRRVRETLTRAALLVGSGGANAAEIEHPSSDNRFAYAPAIAIGTLAAALGI
jgi:prepilin peptidase CpaA